MQKTGLIMAGLGALSLGLAACSPNAADLATTATPAAAPAAAPMADMPTAPAEAGPITGMGKITAIDAAAGTVTIDHQAIPAVSWDAMSMGFTATDPTMLKDLKVGDAVTFELKSVSEPSVVTKVQKQ
jgi:Cu/Ag efflux protein CusF